MNYRRKACTIRNTVTARRLLFLLVLGAVVGWGQKPVIFPGGVVNAASYGSESGIGSIAAIFGTNLAVTTETAPPGPLPTQFGGTSVTVNGVPAPLFYVSPGQINIQVPSYYPDPLSSRGIVVSTPAGGSDPYLQDALGGFGIFTLDGSGCGRGAVLNVRQDGTVSLNSPSNSVSPGDYISVYGTGVGLVYNAPPDGMPTPLEPLAPAPGGPEPALDFMSYSFGPYSYWAGRAPGLIGVDQINIPVPDTVREGCAVPLQVAIGGGNSQPVPISIRNGGGPCMDPPSAGYGEIVWEKAVTTTAVGSASETDTLTVSLQASPGKQAPPLPVFQEGNNPGYERYFGPSCPLPGYRSLDAGAVTIQGPGLSPAPAPVAPLQEGQVSGLTVYRATLSNGAIQPGSFTVSAGGGADVGPFQSSVQIGSGIQVTDALAGRVFSSMQSIRINWTGGDPDTWVTFTLVHHTGGVDQARFVRARASDSTVTMDAYPQRPIGIAPGPVEIILEVAPDPAQISSFSAPGLSLGGRHSWKYTYRFEGVLLQ